MGQREILQDWINQSWLLPYSNINKVEKQERDRTRKEWRERIEPFLTELSQWLQINQIITQYLDGIEELIVIPNLYRHQIPFAALPIPDTDSPPIQTGLGKRLSDRFHIRHIASCQILQLCQQHDNELTQTTKFGTVEDADGKLQVYLNTLGVFAVEAFLEEISFPADLEVGDSWNAAIR